MNIPLRFAGVLLLSVASLHAQTAGPREFKVDDAWGRDWSSSASAPMEEIVGTTNEVVGLVRIDPGAVRGSGTQARFDVDLTTIKTGIAMRDGSVMKSLGAAAQAKATFTLTKVKTASADTLAPNATVDIVAEGTFSLHGVTKTIDVPAQVTYIPREAETYRQGAIKYMGKARGGQSQHQ